MDGDNSVISVTSGEIAFDFVAEIHFAVIGGWLQETVVRFGSITRTRRDSGRVRRRSETIAVARRHLGAR